MTPIDRTSSEFKSSLELYQRADLLELGRLADAQRWRLHPDNAVTYIIDRNINYTNVCAADCQFCAFYRRPKDGQGYVLSFEEIGAKIDECMAIGGVQILLQGGHNPYIPFEWYHDLMRYIKRTTRSISTASRPPRSSSSASYSASAARCCPRAPARRASTAFPVAAARFSSTRCASGWRSKKAQTEEWLGVQEEAHRQGMKTSVTMMYGLGETDEDRIEHLFRVRELQARTGGFTAFICWPLQPEGTPGMSHYQKTDAVTYLRTLAISRIVLDNVPNLQSSWVTMGHKVGQVALRFGANDYGSLMMEENVVSAAGTTYRTTLGEIDRLIRDAGYRPVRRRQDYSFIEEPAAA